MDMTKVGKLGEVWSGVPWIRPLMTVENELLNF
jgi:hypothetical protein